DGKYVVDEARILGRKTDEAERDAVLGERQVDHRADVVAGAAVLRVGHLRLGPGVEPGRIGLGRDDAQRAGLGARPVERTLGSTQRLDALDVDQPRIGAASALRDRLIVEVKRRRRDSAELDAGARNSAEYDGGATRFAL